jgi:hypothetical protein
MDHEMHESFELPSELGIVQNSLIIYSLFICPLLKRRIYYISVYVNYTMLTDMIFTHSVADVIRMMEVKIVVVQYYCCVDLTVCTLLLITPPTSAGKYGGCSIPQLNVVRNPYTKATG